MNYQHLMPTRYTLDVELKGVVSADVLDNSTKKEEARKARPLQLPAYLARAWPSLVLLEAVHVCQSSVCVLCQVLH